MIEFKTGDILGEDTEALVNTVNCVGVMGRGIALQFRKAFPDNYRSYADACARGDVQPGRMHVFEIDQLTHPRYVINFPTKRHWRSRSRWSDIDSGLDSLVDEIESRKIRSIALPPLGSGLGGLQWSDVRKLILQKLGRLDDVRIVVYEPAGAPAADAMVRESTKPHLTPARATLIGLISHYLSGLMDTQVTLLEIHKLMYFIQESGEDLRLRYVQGHYGPYAENLSHLLHTLEGHYIRGYADGGDDPSKQLELCPGSIEAATDLLRQHSDTLRRFDRVAHLIEGFETPYGLELLSSVHWVVEHASCSSIDDVVDGVHQWSDRKRRFTVEQISIAFEVLTSDGWFADGVGR